jgi:putative hydrolase of the HAD superfamily
VVAIASSREHFPVVRVLLLDLDDTLFDRGAALRRWAAHALDLRRPAELAWLERIDDRGRRPRPAFAEDVLARHPDRAAAASADAFAARFPAELAAHVEPERGLRAMLVALAARVRIAVVTNGGSRAQREKLRRAELDDVVHAVFVSGELGEAKPDAAIFRRALAWGGAAPADCLFVGDDPVNDIAPAATLGMATAWRAREAWPATLAPPTHVLGAITELARLVA